MIRGKSLQLYLLILQVKALLAVDIADNPGMGSESGNPAVHKDVLLPSRTQIICSLQYKTTWSYLMVNPGGMRL